MTSKKLPIAELTQAIDDRDCGFYERLSDTDKKGFTGVVAMRFTSAVRSKDAELMLVRTNEIANLNFYDLYEHPELQYRLLASCGLGYKQSHEWIPMAKAKAHKSSVHEFFHDLNPSANAIELDIIIRRYDREKFATLLRDQAMPDKEMKKLLDAFDDVGGSSRRLPQRLPLTEG